MKPFPVITCVSLLANAGLLIALLAHTPSAPATHSHNAAPTSPASVERSSASSPSTSSVSPSAGPAQGSSLWSQLYTEDLALLMSRLKSAGFTYREMRTIVSEVGGKKFEIAEEELLSQRPKTPYWKNQRYRGDDQKAFNAKYQALMQERSAFYTKYFGSPDSLAEDPDLADFARQQYGPFSLEKLQAITRIRNDYDELAGKLSADRSTRSNSRTTTEDRQKQRLVENELERDLQQILTPEEFAEYQYRESPTAHRLREQYELLRLSETEYKALFALQRSIDQQFDIWSPDKEGQAAYADAQEALAPKIEAALGPDRYADYQQLTKGGQDQVTRLMSRLELPLATAGKITSLRDAATERAKTLRSDTALAPADRDARLAILARETETQLSTLLRTPRGLEAYAELKGDWLRALQPKPATP